MPVLNEFTWPAILMAVWLKHAVPMLQAEAGTRDFERYPANSAISADILLVN